MRVELKIDARHDPGGDRHPFATYWIAVGRYRRFQCRNSAQLQWQHILEKIRSRYGDHRQVAIMRDELYLAGILIRIAVAFDREIAAIGNDMGVGHDSITAYDETGANAPLEPSCVPRRFVIGLH